MKIVIAEDFSDAPGARYRDDGDKSGQEFYEELLRDRFSDALNAEEVLVIDLDGTWGYASSFLSEAFGLLADNYGSDLALSKIKIVSDEDPSLVDTVKQEIRNPYTRND